MLNRFGFVAKDIPVEVEQRIAHFLVHSGTANAATLENEFEAIKPYFHQIPLEKKLEIFFAASRAVKNNLSCDIFNELKTDPDFVSLPITCLFEMFFVIEMSQSIGFTREYWAYLETQTQCVMPSLEEDTKKAFLSGLVKLTSRAKTKILAGEIFNSALIRNHQEYNLAVIAKIKNADQQNPLIADYFRQQVYAGRLPSLNKTRLKQLENPRDKEPSLIQTLEPQLSLAPSNYKHGRLFTQSNQKTSENSVQGPKNIKRIIF